ncbi:MAG: hypothetical protein QOE70_1322 [Chthoniobacter sp.]|jgi:hypothetical protein|nr:hypothetical protein [Chthoniobacter sp.]
MTKSEILDLLGAEERIRDLAQAERYVGGAANLKRMRDAGLVKPWKKLHRDVQFDVCDLDAAIDHIKQHGWPVTQAAAA